MSPVQATKDAIDEVRQLSPGAMFLMLVLNGVVIGGGGAGAGSALFVSRRDFDEFRQTEATTHAEIRADATARDTKISTDVAVMSEQLKTMGGQIKQLLDDTRAYQTAMRQEVQSIGRTVDLRLPSRRTGIDGGSD